MKRSALAVITALTVIFLTGAAAPSGDASDAFLSDLTSCETPAAPHTFGTAVASGGVALHSYGSAVAPSVC